MCEKYDYLAMAEEIAARADEIYSEAEIEADRIRDEEQILALQKRNEAITASVDKLNVALADPMADHEVAYETQEREELDAVFECEKTMNKIDEEYTDRIHAASKAYVDAKDVASLLM